MKTYLPTNMLDDLIARFNPTSIVEVGTYYAGWTTYLESITNARIWTLQSPVRLNHLDDSNDGEYSGKEEAWKRVSDRLDPEYRGRYDFNLLARNMSELKRSVCMLVDSPPSFEWFSEVDLAIIDCTRDPATLKTHFDYWIRYAKVVALGHYKTTVLSDETSSMSYDDLFNHCGTHGKVEHYSKNYIWVTR